VKRAQSDWRATVTLGSKMGKMVRRGLLNVCNSPKAAGAGGITFVPVELTN
jgi:hypothetical protein